MIIPNSFCEVRKAPIVKPYKDITTKKFHGLRSLVGYSPWGHKESDTTEQLHIAL